MLPRGGDTGRMNLSEAGIREPGPALVRSPGRRDVTASRVGRQVVDVGVAAGREHDRLRRMRLDPAGDEIPNHDPARPSVDDHHIEQLSAGVHLHLPRVDLFR